MRFSHSRLSTYERCPLRFKYAYIDKVETEVEQSVEAFMGSIVHKTLEKLYRDLKFMKLNSVTELIEFFNEEWKKNWNNSIQIVRKEYTKENYRAMGEKYIRDYYARHFPFDGGKTIALEQKVLINLDKEGRYKLRGVIDRVSEVKDDEYEIHDYKTAGTLPLQEYLDMDRQMALYMIAVMERFKNAKKIEIVWHFLAFDKEIRSTRTEKQLDKLKEECIKLIDKINEARKRNDFEAVESALCDWCEFASICPKRAHLKKVENLKPNEYLNESGVKLVNEFVKLKAQEEHLKEEIEKVKEALFAFSLKEKVDVIAGSDFKARLKTYKNIKFPSKEDVLREELEDMIKKAGKWMDISNLDTFKLSRMVQNGELDEELIKKLRKFARLEENKQVYLSRM